MAPVFILASLMFNFVILLTNMVAEKESGVRGAMSAMGLLPSAYWTAAVLPELITGTDTPRVRGVLLTGVYCIRLPPPCRMLLECYCHPVACCYSATATLPHAARVLLPLFRMLLECYCHPAACC